MGHEQSHLYALSCSKGIYFDGVGLPSDKLILS